MAVLFSLPFFVGSGRFGSVRVGSFLFQWKHGLSVLVSRRLRDLLRYPYSRAFPPPHLTIKYLLYCYLIYHSIGRLSLYWCQKYLPSSCPYLFSCLLSKFPQDLVWRHFWSSDLDLELTNLTYFISAQLFFSIYYFSRVFLLPCVFFFCSWWIYFVYLDF